MASLLSLPGDLLAVIYSCLGSPADKKAFYHTHPSIWKSPAVNTRIYSLKLSSCLSSQELVKQLARFPLHASLRALTIAPLGWILSQRGLEEIFTAVLNSAKGARLNSVEQLTIEKSYLSEPCASFIALLFPKLQNGGAGCIVFRQCSVPGKFLPALGLKVQLRELVLDGCEFHDGGKFEESVSTVRSLKELTFMPQYKLARDSRNPDNVSEVMKSEVVCVSALKDLHQLQTLTLHNCTAVGLDEFLQHVPLKGLGLLGKSGWLPAQEGSKSLLHSESLQVFWLGTVDPVSGWLMSARLPALQQVHLSAISCMKKVPGCSFDETRAHLVSVVEWIVKQPLSVDETLTIHVSGTIFASNVLTALLSFRFSLLKAKRLAVCVKGGLTFDLIDILSEFVDATPVRELHVEAREAEVHTEEVLVDFPDGDGYTKNIPTEDAMVYAVETLPMLSHLSVDSRQGSPAGTIATLFAAAQMHRPLDLHVVCGIEADEMCSGDEGAICAGVLQQQWEHLQRTTRGASKVNLFATGYCFGGDF